MLILDDSWRTFVGTFLVILSVTGASTAGVGGGALLIPIFLLIFNLNVFAIPMAKATVFGAAIAMFVRNVRKKRPGSNTMPLIQYDVALLLEPPTLLGTLWGVRLNKVFPFWIIGILLFLLMAITTYKTFRKALRMYRRESLEELEATGGLPDDRRALLGKGNYSDAGSEAGNDDIGVGVGGDDEDDEVRSDWSSGVDPAGSGRRDGVGRQLSAAGGPPLTVAARKRRTGSLDGAETGSGGVAIPVARSRSVSEGVPSPGGDHSRRSRSLSGGGGSLSRLLGLPAALIGSVTATSRSSLGGLSAVDDTDGSELDYMPPTLTRGLGGGGGGGGDPFAVNDDEVRELERSASSVSTRPERTFSHEQALKRPQFPWTSVAQLWFAWAVVLVVTVAAGGGGNHTSVWGIDCGSAVYWVVICIPFPVLGLQTWLNVRHEWQRFDTLARGGHVFSDGEVQWTVRNTLLFTSLSFLAGVCSAMMGIGGSTIKGPFLLQIIKQPQVATATSAFMLLTTAASSMVQFMVLQMLPYGPGFIFVGVGFVSATLGQHLMQLVVKRYSRFSFIVFALAGYLGVGMLTMGTITVMKTYEDFSEHETNETSFVALCADRYGDGDGFW